MKLRKTRIIEVLKAFRVKKSILLLFLMGFYKKTTKEKKNKKNKKQTKNDIYLYNTSAIIFRPP
jgi:hypothetical protein